MNFAVRKRSLWEWWIWESQSSLLPWGALHVYRLARKLWGSDGKKGFLAVRTGKGMAGPLWETSLLCPRLCGLEFHSYCCGYRFQSDRGHPGKNALGLPISICLGWKVKLSVSPGSSLSWFSKGNWGDLEVNVLTRETVRAWRGGLDGRCGEGLKCWSDKTPHHHGPSWF